MSLDVALFQPTTVTCEKCGHEQHVSNGEQWLFDANITHNLNRMAGAAGIYDALWRPDEMYDKEAAKRADELWRQGHHADAEAIRSRILVTACLERGDGTHNDPTWIELLEYLVECDPAKLLKWQRARQRAEMAP